jgi:hypothetical protein
VSIGGEAFGHLSAFASSYAHLHGSDQDVAPQPASGEDAVLVADQLQGDAEGEIEDEVVHAGPPA